MSSTRKETIDLGAGAFTAEAVLKREAKSMEDQAKQSDKESGTSQFSATMAKTFEKSQAAHIKMEAERQKMMMKDEAKAMENVDEARKKPVIAKINRYIQTFPFLSQVVPKVSPRASLLELNEILKIVREEMSSQRSIYQLHKYCDYGLASLEGVWKDGSGAPKFVPAPLRLNLTSLSTYYRQGLFDKEIEPLLQEIDIEYPWLGRQSLIWRGIETITEILTKTHLMNSSADARNVMGVKNAPPKNVNMEGL